MGLIELRSPSVDFVKFQEDARRTLVEREVVLLRAGFVAAAYVDIADFAWWRRSVPVTVEDVLTGAGCLTLLLVH